MYGLVSDVVNTDSQLKQWFGAIKVTRLTPTWSENLVGILISWPVRLALIALFLICVVVEFATGSTGLFGVGAAVSMALLIGAPWLAGLAQWWDILFVVLGLALIATEILVIPGTGFTGFAGVACLFAGIIGSFVSGDLSSSTGQAQLITGIGTVVGGCIIAIIASWIILRQFGDSHAIRQLVLTDEVITQPTPPIQTLTQGDEAIAITDLRPSGKIERNAIIYDATSTGEWITTGTKVRIMQSGMTIEVEEMKT
jgi:membrane-bound serine protease (ClpP class)